MSGRIDLYWNTFRHLKREQIVHRALRVLRFRGVGPVPEGLVEADGWEPRVPRCPHAVLGRPLDGVFVAWGEERQLLGDAPWIDTAMSTAWNYPVQYLDAAPALAAMARASGDESEIIKVRDWMDHWIASHQPGRNSSISWDPYPTALRIVNLLDAVAILGRSAPATWREGILRSVWQQSVWLARNVEMHLLGTHLLKDAKALLIAGSVFEDGVARHWRELGETILRRELPRQVRADGSHEEPTLPYQGMVLEDVLDLINFAPIGSGELAPILRTTAERLLEFAHQTQTPAGTAPLLGDTGEERVPPTRTLLEYAARLGFTIPDAGGGVRLLEPSGIAVYRGRRQYVLADVGGVGTDHVPGHGHCDSLSFEWWVDGVPILVDTGTLSYVQGAARTACRSTRAHNTIEIDGYEQHEIWAAFRVARRATVRARLDSNGVVEADLIPWHDRQVRLTRRFVFDETTTRVEDGIEGPGSHGVVSRMHLHPECEIEPAGRTLRIRHGRANASILMPEQTEILVPPRSTSVHCAEPGIPRPNIELQVAYDGALPWTSIWELRVGS